MRGQQSLYDQFGTYLTKNGLYMASQFSSDSFAGQLANQTNLGVKVCILSSGLPGWCPQTHDRTPSKSIVALKAASEIFQILGDNDKSQQYNVRRPIPRPRRSADNTKYVFRRASQHHSCNNGKQSHSLRTRLTTLFRMGTTRREYRRGGGIRDDLRGPDATIRWGLLYNLYADRLLGFDMFPQSVYDTREPRSIHPATWIQIVR